MAKQFTPAEWKPIRARLEEDPQRYGLPQRECGSVLLGSFIVRKLGSSRSRSPDTWEFLADVCRTFDLLAVQEIMDDLSGLRRLMSLLGPEFSLVVSDLTGVFPGEPGLGERLGFIYLPMEYGGADGGVQRCHLRPYQGHRLHCRQLRGVRRRPGTLRKEASWLPVGKSQDQEQPCRHAIQ